MENTLNSLSLQDLVALEKIVAAVCKKYENIAEMNKYATNKVDAEEFKKATISLAYFNGKRNKVLEEMENRITGIV